MTNTEIEYTVRDCRNYGDNSNPRPCGGEVWERWSRSGLTSTVRCQNCQDAHDDVLDGIAQRYPDTPHAPAWFDPTYAGESWDYDY